MNRNEREAMIEKLAADKARAFEYLAERRMQRELVGDFDDGTTLLETSYQAPIRRHVYEPPPAAPQQPQQPAPVLDTQTQKRWNDWSDERTWQIVMKALDIVADETGALARTESYRIDARIDALSAEIRAMKENNAS